VGGDLGDSFNEVLSAEDVATYGCLCGLATFQREELKRRFFDGSNAGTAFKEYLSLVPQVSEKQDRRFVLKEQC
jgi:COP9 signalosome complex subunit 1